MNDLEVYKKAISVLSRGENIAVITVISTIGSTPGKIGYKTLVWGKNGQTFGTVGGGLTEAKMINVAKDMLGKAESRVFTFDKDGSFDEEKGIPEQILRRVYSPIGISIGAFTPEEISLSIVCELVKIRRLGNTSGANHMTIVFSKCLQEDYREAGSQKNP